MKIAIIGTINKDLILPFGDAPIESFGGIFYDISVLAELLDETDEIIPISYIGEDVAPTIEAILSKVPQVNTDGLILLSQLNHKVILEYTSPVERQEKSLFQFPSLGWKQISEAANADIIIVNLISGWDVTLEAYRKLSKTCRDKMYLDVHYLLMGIDDLGRRYPELPKKTDEWIQGARFVQMNKIEYDILAADSRNLADFYQTRLSEDQVLLATRGAEGVIVVSNRDGMIRQKDLPGYESPGFVDATGCGDAFGAGFAVKYHETGDFTTAADFANLVAGAKTALRGTNEMYRLKDTMAEMLRTK